MKRDAACYSSQAASDGERGVLASFARLWRIATADENITLHGFHRFKTSHLLNLRFLEDEIRQLDREIYQAGMQLDAPIPRADRLGLGRSQRDTDAKAASEKITRDSILRLRRLIQEYDDALLRFNQMMQMQTFALSDDTWHSDFRGDLNKWEQSKTRLVRTDLPAARIRSPLENGLNHLLRAAWQTWKNQRSTAPDRDEEAQQPGLTPRNVIRATKCITCFLVAVFSAAVLVVPLLLLSDQSNAAELLKIGMFIVVFCFAVSFRSGSSALATMGVTAAYAAVLVVFISNNP
ncbi:hypothetical protein SLS54_008270 [Diplodia seriata]